MKILFMTVAKVFKAEGISSETSVTMEKWRGNPPDPSTPAYDQESEMRNQKSGI